MKNEKKVGVLLVNLGTPEAPTPFHVAKFLTEFLMDSRVIDVPFLKRSILVRLLIIPSRKKKIAEAYARIWTDQGSPLLVNSQNFEKRLQKAMGETVSISLAMRYQTPSIEEKLQELQKKRLDTLLILPLFPQYASATSGSILQHVMGILSQWNEIPKIKMISQFHDYEPFIEAFAIQGRKYPLVEYDHILFSFHGLPQRQMEQSSPAYQDDCKRTAELIAKRLNISTDRYSVSFQSRLGKEPWTQPYTTDIIEKLAKAHKKKVLVFSPAFVADCIETLHEIQVELQDEFRRFGGDELHLVEGLNDSPHWVEAVQTLIAENI